MIFIYVLLYAFSCVDFNIKSNLLSTYFYIKIIYSIELWVIYMNCESIIVVLKISMNFHCNLSSVFKCIYIITTGFGLWIYCTAKDVFIYMYSCLQLYYLLLAFVRPLQAMFTLQKTI